MTITHRARALAAALTIAISLAGCASSADDLTITDPWVKAVDSGMTAAFGVVTNDTGADVTIVAAETASASRVELHETVMGDDGAMMMQEVGGGFAIAAGEHFTLEPGGNHLMLMGVTEPLEPGSEVEITLELAGGDTLTFTAIVKEFAGANEEYDGEMTGTMDEG